MEAVSDTDPEQNLSLPALTFRPQPTTVEETGLDDSQCVDLVLKTLRSGGRLSGGEIANRLCLSFRIIETILNFLKQELMIETVALLPSPSSNSNIHSPARETKRPPKR